MKNAMILASMLIPGVVSGASAAVVTLDIQADQATKTFAVYASLSDDNDGLASFSLDILGAGGTSVTGSVLQATRVYDAVLDDFKGFRLLRSNGTNGIDVRASQDTVGGAAAGPSLILDLGITAPLLLATGTYSANAGTLTAVVHPGSFFNVFPTNFVPGGSTVAATSVVSDAVVVPEPLVGGWIVAAGLGLLGRRRRR